MKRHRQQSQLALRYRATGHGGARAGAGRKRTQGRRKVAHRARQRFSSPRPLHVTIRVHQSVRSLRKRKKYQVLHDVFCKTRRRGFRICHYSVQDDHIHLIAEASNRASMTSGMRAVNIRIGKGINKAYGRRRGPVIAERYHEQPLSSPRQVRNTLAYVLNNVRRHVFKETGETCKRDYLDPCSSAAYFDGWKPGPADPIPIERGSPVEPARTWLLNKLWRRHGLVDVNTIPGPQAGPR